MNVKTFIDKPVLSIVISIGIVVLGIIGLSSLPVEQYPDIAPPTIAVSATYPGADAETVQKTVIAPLEEAINGVENMTYIKSTSTNQGTASISVYFNQGTDPDMAAVNVQNRVAQAAGILPTEVNQIGVVTSKQQSSILQILAISSPNHTYDDGFLTNYFKINIEPELSRINGIGEVNVLGGGYSMRIWLRPDVMAQYKIVPSDIVAILGEQNIEASTGAFGENSGQTYQYTMKYKGRLEKPEEFGQMVIRTNIDGEVLRLTDIADIELGKETYSFSSGVDGSPGSIAMLAQTAGSNATEINAKINAFLDEARLNLPPDVEISCLMSTDDFLFASIKEVISTLILSILLVILVVYVFLQNFRATLIPAISMIVSVIGTFAFMAVAGFTINLLTLFAIVLTIGTVVDNAIVVVEAVQTRFDEGYRAAYLASVDAMKGITSAIVASTLVFMAVFIPVSFMGGTSGTFYTQFGITMAVSVGISAINSLTLCPALCALILKPHRKTNLPRKQTFEDKLRNAYNSTYKAIQNRYQHGAAFFLRRRWLAWLIVGATIVGLVLLMNNTKTGLVPQEDMGIVFVEVTTAPGTSLDRTAEILEEIESRIGQIDAIETYGSVVGYGITSGQAPSSGTYFIRLRDWSERKDKRSSVEAVQGQIYSLTADIKDAQLFVFSPPMIIGYGMSNGFEFHLQDNTGGDIETFFGVAQNYLMELNQRPEILAALTSYNVNFPQYRVDVDAVKCKRAGISPAEVLQTLGGYYGGMYASDFTRFSKVYRVMIQASPEYRMDTESLNNIFVRVGNEMAPISQFLTIQKEYGAETMNRFNLLNSIAVNGMAADGYSSGDAIRAIEETAARYLPQG